MEDESKLDGEDALNPHLTRFAWKTGSFVALQRDREEKVKADEHIYTIIKVARDEDLASQIGKDIYFDLVDFDKVKQFRFPKQLPFGLFKEEVAKEFGIPLQFQRFWLVAEHPNHIYRPNRPLILHEEALSAEQLSKVSNGVNNAELKLFLGVDFRPFPSSVKSKESIMLFFKLYNPNKEELCYAGRLFVNVNGKPLNILTRLNEMAGYAVDQEIALYKEVKFHPDVVCEHIDKELTFHDCELQDGDVVCFQRSIPAESALKYRFVDVPSFMDHIHSREIRLMEEREKKKKAEAHLYIIVKVARDEDLAEQIGKDIYFDLVDFDRVKKFSVPKKLPFNLFKEGVEKEFGVPVQFQQVWFWAKRQNYTYRPGCPLMPHEEAQSVDQIRRLSNPKDTELKLFLGVDFRPIPPPFKSEEDIMLFFKLYDPVKEELRYVGRLFVKVTGKPLDILARLNEMAGYTTDQEIELYEEVRFRPMLMCLHIEKEMSFQASQLGDGDIVCFQKSSPAESAEKYRYVDVPSFLDYVNNRQVVHFKPFKQPTDDEFCLELLKLHTYDDVVERVARHLGLNNPSEVRLTNNRCCSQKIFCGMDLLSDMLVKQSDKSSGLLYYEVMKILNVAFYHATKDEVALLVIKQPKQSTVGDLLNDLRSKVNLHPGAELRLLLVSYHKIYKILPIVEKIENLSDQFWTLRAEEIPEEEKNLDPHDKLINVFHFTKETVQNQMELRNFGNPFFFVVRGGETLADVKVRVQRKLQVADDEFAKWKFAFLSLHQTGYLADADIVSARFQQPDSHDAWEQYLGLEHSEIAS